VFDSLTITELTICD